MLALCLLSAACGTRETPVEAGIREQVLHLGNLSEPKDLDPHIVTGLSAYNVIAALHEGLVSEDHTAPSMRPVPGVSTHWNISADRTVYTFHLRKNARWSNGDPVTAADFVFSYQRILSPTLGSPYASMLHLLKNARAFNHGSIDDFGQVGAKALDAHTLQLTLEHPVPSFLAQLNHWSWFPVHPPTILAHGAIDQIGTAWTRPENHVGNGPFTLKSWRQNQLIAVEKSPTYWDADTVKLNEIRFYPIGDHTIEERSFRAGQLHVTGTIPADRVPWYRTNRPDVLRLDPYLRSYYYLFNVRKPPLDDVRVRKALSLAIDRDQLARYLTRSGESPAFSFTPPGIGTYDPPQLPPDNIERARKLLAQAGFPNGEGFPPLTLLFHTSDLHDRIAQAIQQRWLTTLGIRIELENTEWKVYQSRRENAQFDIARAEWVADYIDPSTFLDVWLADSGNNHAGWSSPDYDRLLQQAAQTADEPARLHLLQQAEALLLDEQPIIPLLFFPSKSLVHPAVQGWNPSILDRHPYKHISLQASD